MEWASPSASVNGVELWYQTSRFLRTRANALRGADGWYYYIHGCPDDLILAGGEKLSLLEIDECLLEQGRRPRCSTS